MSFTNPRDPGNSGVFRPVKIRKIKFPCPVKRLRVTYDGKWRLAKQVQISSMTLCQSQPLPKDRGRGIIGFWYEIVDKGGELIYRCFRPNPMERSVELMERGGEIVRRDVDKPQILFDLLMPDLPEAAKMVLYSSITANGKRLKKARVLHELALKKPGRKGGKNGNR